MKAEKRTTLALAVAVFLVGLSAWLPPARAVHLCGEPHKHDHSRHDHKWNHSHGKHRCNGVREDSFFSGDPRADAPELAYRGPYAVGVRTLRVTNRNELDILNWSEDNTTPRYDRRLRLEIWYPAHWLAKNLGA